MASLNPRKDIQDLQRFKEILKILFDEGFGFLLDRLDLTHHLGTKRWLKSSDETVPGPERLRHAFERLGPTFIKFGQILSERPDVIPESYADELEKLEYAVPTFESEKALNIVDEEIGLENFDEFEEEPIAAASIAQVHKAKYRGDEVAVKIRRPGIREKMEKDIDVLLFLAKKADKHLNLGNDMVYREVKEFAEWTKAELNLKNEGKSAKRFKENLEDEERAVVPKAYLDATTEKVLTLEFVEAVKCNDTEAMKSLDIDEKEIAKTGLRAFLKQVLRDGFIHVDPHPSNFMVRKDGKLVYLDFGMMADITPDMQRNIGLLIMHTYDEDIDGVMQTLKRMSYVEDDADLDNLRSNVEKLVVSLRNSSIEEQGISNALIIIAKKAAENGVYLPTKFILIGKGILTMEGIGLKIYPDLGVGEEYPELVRKIVLKNHADPKEIGQSFMIDMVENKDLLTKLPSKINNAIENGSEPSRTKVETSLKDQDSELMKPALILGSAFLISNSFRNSYAAGLGILGLVYTAYLHYSDN